MYMIIFSMYMILVNGGGGGGGHDEGYLCRPGCLYDV